MKYAVVQSGGKQYRCEEGGFLEIDRLTTPAGEVHSFKDVLLIADGESVKVGAPTVSGAEVKATVVGDIKGPKLTVFNYKAKERQRTKTGHRQVFTRLKIDSIVG